MHRVDIELLYEIYRAGQQNGNLEPFLSVIGPMIAEFRAMRNTINANEISHNMQPMVSHSIRRLLIDQNVPMGTFLDDHVANAIVQRNIAEQAREAIEEHVVDLRALTETFTVDLRALLTKHGEWVAESGGASDDMNTKVHDLLVDMLALIDGFELPVDISSTRNISGAVLASTLETSIVDVRLAEDHPIREDFNASLQSYADRGLPDLTLYNTKLGRHGTFRLDREEAEALYLGLTEALKAGDVHGNASQ